MQISDVDPEVSQTSQSVPDVSPNVHEDAQDVPDVTPNVHEDTSNVNEPTSHFQANTAWRLVGLMSSVVGLLCYALSPSFNQLIGGWNSFKVVLYGVFSLVISTTMIFVKQSSLSTRHVQYKPYMKFAVLMMISVYSFFYDKAVSGKPEILSVVSNAAFALISLSLSKLVKLGFEVIFSYFLGCLAIQLWTIDGKLILVAIIFGCPLFILQSSSDSQPDVSKESQVIHSDSDSQTRPTDGSQDIHSSSDSTPDIDSHGQHVVTIPGESTRSVVAL